MFYLLIANQKNNDSSGIWQLTKNGLKDLQSCIFQFLKEKYMRCNNSQPVFLNVFRAGLDNPIHLWR